MWASLFMGLTGPIVARILLTLGMGIVSFVGFTAVINLTFNTLQNSFNSVPAAAGQLIFLAGIPQAIAILLSALAARVTLMQMKKIQIL
jgi:uncharacterized protein YhhL (DUF1145 family)